MPKVSVVLPSFNSEKYIGEAIDSVLTQSFSDFELIAVDSNSTDRTLDIIQAYQDKRIKIISAPFKCGESTPRNLGYMAAVGEYIVNMDSDDIMYKDRLLKQVNFLDANADVDILGSSFTLFEGERRSKRPQPVSDGEIKAKMLIANGNAMMNPTVMLRRAFIEKNWVYYPPLMVDADHGFWIECIKNGATFANLKDGLLDYRVHQNNMSRAHPQNKTPLRVELLGMYFSDLSCNECGKIAVTMEEGRVLSLYEAYGGIRAIDNALRISVCDFGADIKVLKSVLIHFRRLVADAINASLKGARASLT